MKNMTTLNTIDFKHFIIRFSDELINIIRNDDSNKIFIETKFFHPIYNHIQFFKSCIELLNMGFNVELMDDIIKYAIEFGNDVQKLNKLIELIAIQYKNELNINNSK